MNQFESKYQNSQLYMSEVNVDSIILIRHNTLHLDDHIHLKTPRQKNSFHLDRSA